MAFFTADVSLQLQPMHFLLFAATTFAAFFAICLAVLRRKRIAKIVPAELQNRRILNFHPEPLISEESIAGLARNSIETPQPAEPSGAYNLAKVDFLDLMGDAGVKECAERSIRRYGVGTCGPRGFYGTLDVHLNLERKIAEFMGLEESVLYSYGFSTVASAIGAYCKRNDVIFSDERISFAARQGFLAARSTVVYFRHNDVRDLERKLEAIEREEGTKKRASSKFLVVEGVYGSTGTICPLPELMELRARFKLRLFIDETFSFGVLGAHGRGATEYHDVDRGDVDMIMGSLEGSICSIGGFCVGASVVMEHQRLSGLGYCFSASLPAFLTEIATRAIERFEADGGQFARLTAVSRYLHERLLRTLDAHVRLLGDADSPVKVLRFAREVDARMTREFCEGKRLYFAGEDDCVVLYASTGLREGDVDAICGILKQALARSSVAEDFEETNL